MAVEDPNGFKGLADDIDALVLAWADRGTSVRAAWLILCISGLVLAEREGLTDEQAIAILTGAAERTGRGTM